MIRADGGRRRKPRIARFIVISFLILPLLVWSIGFMWFVGIVSRVTPDNPAPADGVVVLTGGTKRLSAGFDLLASGRAGHMLVSGVNTEVSRAQLRSIIVGKGESAGGDLFDCCVELGFLALDTEGNAREAAAWAKRHNVQSVLLVTNNYHMARSLIEFAHAVPWVRIEPYPVIATNVVLEAWWRWPGSVRLLAVEYHKLILAGLRVLITDALD